MAREDTRWFVAGVVALSVVLLLALPISALVVIDYLKMRSELNYEIRQLRKFKQEMKEKHEKPAAAKSASAADGV